MGLSLAIVSTTRKWIDWLCAAYGDCGCNCEWSHGLHMKQVATYNGANKCSVGYCLFISRFELHTFCCCSNMCGNRFLLFHTNWHRHGCWLMLMFTIIGEWYTRCVSVCRIMQFLSHEFLKNHTGSSAVIYSDRFTVEHIELLIYLENIASSICFFIVAM